MLADLNIFNDMTPDEARNPAAIARYYRRLDDFRRLRSLIQSPGAGRQHGHSLGRLQLIEAR